MTVRTLCSAATAALALSGASNDQVFVAAAPARLQSALVPLAKNIFASIQRSY